MKLNNSFVVPGDADEVFAVLLDLEQVATCMPGAKLAGRDGDEYQGDIKLRIGPITAAYTGTVTVRDVDRSSRQAVLHAAGSEVNGQGGADATITARVDPEGDVCRVGIVSEVTIRGKAAQFGRGALGDVTQRILDQFSKNLESVLLADGGDGGKPEETEQATSRQDAAFGAPPSDRAPSASDEDASLDLLAVVVLPILRKWAPGLLAGVAGFALGAAYGRRKGRSQGGSRIPVRAGAGSPYLDTGW